MRLGFDLSPLGPLPTGVGRYAACLLEALLRHPAIREIHGFGPDKSHLKNLPTSAKLHVHADTGRWRIPWLLGRLPAQAAQFRLDVFHFPNYLAPLRFPCPYTVTVHDLTVFDLPGVHPLKRRAAHRLLLRPSLDGAAKIIAVSEDTRQQVLKRWAGLDRKIRVIHEAALAYMVRVTDQDELDEVRNRY